MDSNRPKGFSRGETEAWVASFHFPGIHGTCFPLLAEGQRTVGFKHLSLKELDLSPGATVPGQESLAPVRLSSNSGNPRVIPPGYNDGLGFSVSPLLWALLPWEC